MRILHTSDWHLGRSFHGASLQGAHEAFVDHLVEVVARERVSVVVVCGDVYDRALPGPESVELLSEALTRIVSAGAQVVLTSGNHDSAIRLGFAASLLTAAGVHVHTRVDTVGRPVLVGELAIYPVPYLEPAVTADALSAPARTHAAVLATALRRVRDHAHGRTGLSIVMAHAVVAGGAAGDVERDISVGGVAAVPAAVFGGLDYVALGHLHVRQRVTEAVRYSGSPVALSFGESRHRKGCWLVDLAARGAPQVVAIDTPEHRAVAVLRGELSQLLADPAYDWAERAWCQVTLTDAVRPPAALDAVRRRFPETLQLLFEPSGEPHRSLPARYHVRRERDTPVAVCREFLAHVRGGRGPDSAEESVLVEAVDASRVGRKGREQASSVRADDAADRPARDGAA